MAAIFAICSFLTFSTSALDCAASIAWSASVLAFCNACWASFCSSVVVPRVFWMTPSWSVTFWAISAFAAGLTCASCWIWLISFWLVVTALSTSSLLAAWSMSLLALVTAASTFALAALCSSVVEFVSWLINRFLLSASCAIVDFACCFLSVDGVTSLIWFIPLVTALATSSFVNAWSILLYASFFLGSKTFIASFFSSVVDWFESLIACFFCSYAWSIVFLASGFLTSSGATFCNSWSAWSLASFTSFVVFAAPIAVFAWFTIWSTWLLATLISSVVASI